MKKTLLLLAKVGFVAAYSVVFAEFFIRLMDPVALMPRYVTDGGDGIRMNIPNASYWQTTPEVKVQIRTNSQGMRADRDFERSKGDGKCRIALFGDSFFMGYEVDLNETFAAKLEADLNEEGYAVEVLNFAVSGFGSAENLIALKERALPFRPDIVIFEWHRTDVDDDQRSELFRLEDGRLVRHASEFLPAIELRDYLMQFGIYRWLIGNSHLYSVTREKMAVAVKGLLVKFSSVSSQAHASQSPSGERVPSDNGSADNKGSELSFAILETAQRVSREAGAFFMVAAVPGRESRTKFESSVPLLPPEAKDELVIANPVGMFRKYASVDTKIYREQGHFHLSPLGNQLLTDVVKKTLVEKNALGACNRENRRLR